MKPRWLAALAVGILGIALWSGIATPAQAEDTTLNRFYYYPYYYFPHNYWPSQGPKYPEPPGAPYMPPPAYMAYPPFKEPNWHYHFFEAHRYYRGFHFWLDQF
jgi:hypothetical protein